MYVHISNARSTYIHIYIYYTIYLFISITFSYPTSKKIIMKMYFDMANMSLFLILLYNIYLKLMTN